MDARVSSARLRNVPKQTDADIHYFVRSTDGPERSWDDVPDDIKRTFDRIGIPEAERKFLSGVSAQYERRIICLCSQRCHRCNAAAGLLPY